MQVVQIGSLISINFLDPTLTGYFVIDFVCGLMCSMTYLLYDSMQEEY